MSILCFAGVCCLVLGKWLIFLMYGGADCPWRLVVGVNDLLYVAFQSLQKPQDDPVKVETCRPVYILFNVYEINCCVLD
jgi:hypothetical protein